MIGQFPVSECVLPEKFLNSMGIRVGSFDAGIIRAVGFEKFFVLTRELRFVRAVIIPNDHHPAFRGKNAAKFAARSLGLEPVKSLARGDEIDARIRKLRGFRFGGDAREIFVAPQKFFTRGAHFRIGLHTENPIAVIEKKFAENSGAGTDVCDYLLLGQAALLLQNTDESLRVAWAVP